MKRIISFAVVLCMVISVFAVPASAAESTYVSDYDRETPVVIIHGMSQNDTYILDENGNRQTGDDGTYITGWPLELNVMGLVKEAIGPLLLSSFLRTDM